MPVEIVTKDDLENFRVRMMRDIRIILEEHSRIFLERPEGYRTIDVRKILRCSSNKLISLRITRKLRTKKIGGSLYYNKEDVKRLLDEGY
jgi:hypothetical protein